VRAKSDNNLVFELYITFTKLNYEVYTAIMDEVITGIDRGELKNLLERLDDVQLPQYRELLKTDNPEKFNFYLWNAIVDAFFIMCSAVTVD
jgi:hypothetical protein